MINLKLESIIGHLRRQNYEAHLQTETNQVYVLFKIDSKEFPLFIRVFEESELLQLLVFIPCPLKPEARADVARLLHFFNKELDLPGFGMDERAGVIFFRSMIPTQHKKIDSKLLDAFLATIQNVCKTFFSPIEAVAYGAVSFDEILGKAAELAAKEIKKTS